MVKIKNGIYWVGYIDWNLRNFHGYQTPYGSTYNAYLILDEKTVLIDGVKHYGLEELIWRIKKIVDPTKIDYIVSNHAEMDHSGATPELLSVASNAQVVVSPQGKENLEKQFHKVLNFFVVEDNQTLDIGYRKLRFFHTLMVHWPDSMVTYSEQDEVLFSNDAFGQHFASYERFVDEIGESIAIKEAAKYYANIFLPYGSQVKKTFEKIENLKISTIAPSHGLIWRNKKQIQKILTLYRRWANYETEDKAVIVYDTMWGSTQKIAFSLKDTLEKENIPVELFDLKITHISDIVTSIMFSKIIFFGSPIINNQILPTMGALFTYLRSLRPKNRFGLPFGSYGWAKVGFRELEKGIKESGINLIDESLYFRFVPKGEDLQEQVLKVVSRVKKKVLEGGK